SSKKSRPAGRPKTSKPSRSPRSSSARTSRKSSSPARPRPPDGPHRAPGSRSRALPASSPAHYHERMTAVASSPVHVRRIQFAELEEVADTIPEITAAQMANRWREQSLGYRELLVAERDGKLVGTVSICES